MSGFSMAPVPAVTELIEAPSAGAAAPAPQRSLLGSALRLRRTQVGIVLLIPLLVIVIAGPSLAPHNPDAFIGPAYAPPSAHALLGTDDLGRDVLSRVLAGGRNTLIVSLLATLLGVAVGTALGLAAALFGGAGGSIAMRLLDVIIAFPQLVLVLLFVSLLGSHDWLTICVVALVWAPQVARVMRGAALSVVEQDFVRYSRSLGTSRLQVLWREVLPNVTGPLSVEFGIRLTYSIALIAGLGFLGFGPAPPTPDWGTMISENQGALAVQPWAVLGPVIGIALATLATNLIAEGFAQANAQGGGYVAAS
jgi:peptide/nickel transport system permease protein